MRPIMLTDYVRHAHIAYQGEKSIPTLPTLKKLTIENPIPLRNNARIIIEYLHPDGNWKDLNEDLAYADQGAYGKVGSSYRGYFLEFHRQSWPNAETDKPQNKLYQIVLDKEQDITTAMIEPWHYLSFLERFATNDTERTERLYMRLKHR